MAENIIQKTVLNEIMQKVVALHEDNWRFLTVTADELDDKQFVLIYHFDKDYNTLNLEVTFPKDTVVTSISPIYFAAFWPENEAQDMYGIRFSGLKINYNGTMYFDSNDKTIKTPFCRYTIENKEEGKDK